MDLRIKDVAELLNVSETTIRRWLNEKKLPAYKLNGHYRFSREEIENWVLSQKINKEEENDHISDEKYLSLNDEETKTILSNHIGSHAFSLYRAIYKGGIYFDIEGSTKREVISNAMQHIAKDLNVDKEVITELLMDREKLMPTSLNHGIAIPHTRDFLLQKSHDIVSIVFPKESIEYGALDGEKVNTLFFMFASDDRRHLNLLAKIAHLTKDEESLSFLKQKPSKEELLLYIKNWEIKVRMPDQEHV